MPVLSEGDEEKRTRLTLFALAAFWDVFCEAAFDKAKRENNVKSEEREGAA